MPHLGILIVFFRLPGFILAVYWNPSFFRWR